MIYFFQTIDSTNHEAVRMAEQGASHGTVIHAGSQTGGRGRGGREFFSPSGGLYFSLIIRPQIRLHLLPMITLAAGVGISTCLMANTNVKIQLKWPNDLYLKGKKLGGILTQSGPVCRGKRPDYLVVGVGINLTTQLDHFPSSLRSRVISLYHCNEQKINLSSLLKRLVAAMLASVEKLETNPDALLAEWQSLDYLRGRKLGYESSDGTICAIGNGLAPDGRYIIQDQHGEVHRILAGDLHPINLNFVD